MIVTIGVDVGQSRETSAICVVEAEDREVEGRKDFHFLVRHLERLPQGTPFPDVATRLNQITEELFIRFKRTPVVYLDVTGMGPPILQLFKRVVNKARTFHPVYFNYGDQRVVVEGDQVKIGKAFLVSRLQVLLQENRLHLPASPEALALARDLSNYTIQVDENANDRCGAFRVGRQDDFVTALGLAVHEDPKRQIPLSMGVIHVPNPRLVELERRQRRVLGYRYRGYDDD